MFTRCPNTCWNHNVINELRKEEETLRTFQTTSTKIAIENKKTEQQKKSYQSTIRNINRYSKKHPSTKCHPKALDEFLKENLETGCIRPSKSLMASPFFFIRKKDGKLRPVQDYRKLNEQTIKNKYPLPLVSKLVNKVKISNIFQNGHSMVIQQYLNQGRRWMESSL